MGTKQLALMICFLGCGQVEKIHPDAAIDAAPDAPPDAAPDAFTCPAMQTVCATSCCQSNEGCASNTCIDATASCVNIKELNPNAPSGPYIHSTDNAQFFCDMSTMTPVQYDGLAMGRYNATYTGYSMITATQLQNATIQQAFIWAFNRQGGIPALETWTAGNVCTTDSPAGGARLVLSNSLLFPYQNGNTQSVYTANMIYTEDLVNAGGVTMQAPMAANFFTTYPPGEQTGTCGDASNPALFFKSH